VVLRASSVLAWMCSMKRPVVEMGLFERLGERCTWGIAHRSLDGEIVRFNLSWNLAPE
jgi:hypothetical protein